MADIAFNTPAGQTIARELLIAYLNTGEYGTPVWSPLGNHVEDSSEELDWSEESSQDILGHTRNTMKKPVITQSFDPLPLDSDDTAAEKIWNLAIKDQDAQALAAQDMLIAHFYADDASRNFAERYDACSVRPTSLGGEGGGYISMTVEVTYGGNRTLGTVNKTGIGVEFTPTGE